MNKWYMHKSELVPKMRRATFSGISKYKKDYLISAKRRDLLNVKRKTKNKMKKTQPNSLLCRYGRLPGKSFKNRLKGGKYLVLARKLKKLRNMKVTVILIVIGTIGIVTK